MADRDANAHTPLPVGSGSPVNRIGAIYDGGDDQVEWHGAVPGGADPMTFTFGVDVAPDGWVNGDVITNVITYDDGAGLVFTRTVGSGVSFPDASPSTKWVDKGQALAGDVLTYTIRVENGSVFGDAFTMHDPIPDHSTYVPGSLTYTSGVAGYDAVDKAISWMGVLPDDHAYVNTSGDYEWGDLDSSGIVPGVIFEWVDATAGSVAIDSYTLQC